MPNVEVLDKDKLIFGFELEGNHRSGRNYREYPRMFKELNDDFIKFSDEYSVMFEMITREPFTIDGIHRLKEIVKFMKDNNFYANHYGGIHIHVSTSEEYNKLSAMRNLFRLLCEKESFIRTKFKQRCTEYSNTIVDNYSSGRFDKHDMVLDRGYGIEFRFFDTVFDEQYIEDIFVFTVSVLNIAINWERKDEIWAKIEEYFQDKNYRRDFTE